MNKPLALLLVLPVLFVSGCVGLGAGALVGGIVGLVLFVFLFFVLSFIAFIWALIDIARADKDFGYKIIWVLVCLILGIIGVIIYYFAEKRGKPVKSAKKRK